MTSKAATVERIARLLGTETPRMSTGSTEPREIFDLVNSVLALGIEPKSTKPELAKQIVESAGLYWGADCESRGGTVTLAGLLAVERAVLFFTRPGPHST